MDPIIAQLTNCTTGDRFRQRSLLRVLHGWAKFARKHHIKYYIAFGSLVGYVQRAGLLPHDQDLDVVIPWRETEKLEKLMSTNFSNEFYLRVQPQWRSPYYGNRSYFRDRGINFIAPNARFIDRTGGYYVDIWANYDYLPDATNHSSSLPQTTDTLIEYDNRYRWMTYPRNWTYPLKHCRLSGIPVWCPAQPEKFVVRLYGEIALNTSDTKCINGTWH